MNGLRILFYHIVSDLKSIEYYNSNGIITSKVFRDQLKYFQRYFNVISLDDAYAKYLQGEKFYNDIVLTFDDGFRVNYTIVCDLLSDFNMKAAFFVNNAALDNRCLMWRHKAFILNNQNILVELRDSIEKYGNQFQLPSMINGQDLLQYTMLPQVYKHKDSILDWLWVKNMPLSQDDYLSQNLPYLDSSQIIEMSDAGHCIGSHSVSHPYFNYLASDETIENEIIASIRHLEKVIGKRINSFAFPFERSSHFTEIIKTKYKELEIVLGTNSKYTCKNLSPLEWDRLNMETESFRSRFLFQPIKNSINGFIRSRRF